MVLYSDLLHKKNYIHDKFFQNLVESANKTIENGFTSHTVLCIWMFTVLPCKWIIKKAARSIVFLHILPSIHHFLK